MPSLRRSSPDDGPFLRMYVELANDGACDLPHGVEYTRVLMEWVQAGRPADVAAFIRESANRPPLLEQ